MSRHGLDAEPTAKRIRAVLGGEVVLDSTSVLLVWEHPHYPQYYVPLADITATLDPSGQFEDPPGDFGVADCYDVVAPAGTRAPGAAWSFPDHPEVGGYVRFRGDAMDAWFEEDELVHGHPRSPYTRIDILRSSREVRIELDGVTVAHSVRPSILFETGLPPRYYLPPTDVRLDLLRPSGTRTRCPYKGEATYQSVEIDRARHDDLVWCYPSPLPECSAIAGMLCFHDERADLYLDGVRHE